MKIRLGFVSNSSSSSFAVAVPKGSKGKVSVTVEVDLEAYADNIISNHEELERYMKDNFYGSRDYNMWLAKYSKLIDEGKTILFGSFDSDGSQIEQFLCDNGLTENIVLSGAEVIYGEGGY